MEVFQLKARILTCLGKKEEGAIIFNKCYEESKDDYWPIVDYEDMNKIFTIKFPPCHYYYLWFINKNECICIYSAVVKN